MKKRIVTVLKYVGGTATLVLILGGAALAYMAFTKPPFPPVYYADTNVQCLPRGHRDLAEARRVHLEIFVDGVPETLSHNIGNTITCLTELHTQEAGQVIHAEFYKKARAEKLTYADFFAVWGEEVEREGYMLVITKGSETLDSLEQASLEHLKTVTLTYTSIATTTSETE